MTVALGIGVHFVDIGVPARRPAQQDQPASIDVETIETIDLKADDLIDKPAAGVLNLKTSSRS